jgi:hypothetical protein
LDDGEDNRPTPVTSSTRTAAAAAAAAAATMPGGSGGSGKTRKLKLISRPNRNDVLCGRGGAVNSHPGNVAFRGLVRQHRTAYFAASTRKSDKARIATEIIAQVHSLPGRFLQQADGKTHKWVEINEKRAKKKVGQAFRDITPHDERSRIGAGLHASHPGAKARRFLNDDDRSSNDLTGQDHEYECEYDNVDAAATAAAGHYPDNDTAAGSASAYASSSVSDPVSRKHSFDDDDDDDDDDLQSESRERGTITSGRSSTPPLPPLPAPQPPAAYDHAVGFHPVLPGTVDNEEERGSHSERDNSLSRDDMTGMVTTYNAHMERLSRHRHASNASARMLQHTSKPSRIPASEFVLYPHTEGDSKSTDGDATSAVTDGHESLRGSTESTELEKLTIELLVRRARTWEELYISERAYSRSLEDRLVGLLGDHDQARQQMPKRRRVGYDSDAIAADALAA